MKNKFAENLRNLRKDKGILQKDLANELGVMTRTVSYWETGGQECSLDMLILIAKYFEVSTDFLLGITEY